MAMGAAGRAGAARGQVIVEVLLVFPIFLWLLFSIMEIGHLAFRTILLHHAAYEVARYGSLTCPNTERPSPGCEEPQPNTQAMEQIARRILPGASLDVRVEKTVLDKQENCMNHDIVAVMTQNVPMIFPMTGIWLANKGSYTRRLQAAVPMPVERPLFGR
ncbi:MAG: pilus assembly protein [Elusimicrobia bacterium]|nr:pilus assembly protein [Elusimicrobiota bacterium]